MQRPPPCASTAVIACRWLVLLILTGVAPAAAGAQPGSAPTALVAKPAPAKPAAAKPSPPRPAAGRPSPPPAALTTAAPAAAPVWSVDKAASRISFQALLGAEKVDGVFKTWDAQIAFDPKNLGASHAMITVDTASALTGQPTRDQLLPTAEWLATRKFPKATLVSRSIAQAGPGRYLALADLRLRGTMRRISVPFTLTISHDTGRMIGSMMLDRTVFGIGRVPGLPLTALAPQVKVTMHLTAKRGH